MPARLDPTERPVIASITILPSQKEWLERRARQLSLAHNQHISVSTILRMLIDQYADVVKESSDAVEVAQ